jgi:hypothetical protein
VTDNRYLNNIREIYRELRLHKMICATFLAQSDIDKIIQASRFDEDKDSWTLPTIELPTVFPKVNGSHSDSDPSFGPRGRLEHGDLRNGRPGVHSASSNGGGRNGSAAANRIRSGSRLDGDYNNTGGADSGWRHSVVRDVSSDQLYAASQVLNGRSSTPPTAKTIIATPARLNPMDEHSSLVAPQAAIRSTSSSVRRPSQLVADLEPAVHGADLSHHLGNDTLPSGAPLPRGRGHFEGGHVTSTMGDDRTRVMDELPRGRGHFEPSSIAEEESSLPEALTAARRVRPSFQPAAGVDTSLPTSSSSSSIASMNVRGRGAFEPDMSILRSNSPVSTSLPADHPMNKPRVPFKPSVPIAAAPPPLPDSMNMPRPKRPVFQPALTSTPPAEGEHKTGIDMSSLPPAKSFNPAPLADGRQAGQSRADMEAQMASLPAAKSFQPAVHMAVRQSDSHDPLDINVASRPAFRPSVPSSSSSPLSGGGGGNDGDASPRRPNIPSVPRTRPAFTPATSSVPLSSSPGGGNGMSSSLSSDDPLSFAPKSRPRFEPAGATPAFGMSHNNDNDPLRNAPIPTKPTFRPAFGVRA